MIKAIQTRYDGYIRRHPHEMKEELHLLEERLISQGCMFGEGPIPCFLKPYFLSQENTETLKQVLTHIMSMLEKVIRAYFNYPELRPMFGLSKQIQQIMAVDPGFKRNIVIARPDAFFDGKKFTFIEFNCDSPAGAGWSDRVEEIFYDTFVMRKVSRHFNWLRSERVEALLSALLKNYREFGGSKQHPHIAIVDWRDVRTRHEFLLIKRLFDAKGYPCVIADPRDLKLKGGKLMAGSFQVDLIYRRVIFNELWEKRHQAEDFFKAYRLGKVCVINPLRSRLAANKSVLSILTNSDYDPLFTKEEIKVRNQHIAWTRRLLDAMKVYRNQRAPLIPMIVRDKKAFVIKPSDSYGGRNVSIGKETSRPRWNRLIQHVLRGNGNWVVQELVPIPKMRVPVLAGGRVKLVEKKVNINPFVFNGKYAGAVARLSDRSVINVSAGGGLIPVVTYTDQTKKKMPK